MKTVLCALLTLSMAALPLRADVKPAALFSDHMVIQQGVEAPVWGWADPGEDVTVSVGSQRETTKAGADGKWMVRLQKHQAGESLEMTIKGKNEIKISDILVGEVWIGSGQSNMVFPVAKSGPYGGLTDADDVIKAANFPKIRIFMAQTAKTYVPQTSLGGSWAVCSPETVSGFSAVSYLFARNLHKELGVPVGVVTIAFGASTAEAWISRESLTADPQIKPLLDALDASQKFFTEHPDETADKAPPHPKTINARPGRSGGRQSNPAQDQHFPMVLFNGMVAPIIPYAIKGVIWYQGESIVGGTPGLNLYGHVQQTLVKDWRKQWNQADLPFYIVQLPGQANISNSPRVREEQATILSLAHTGMAVTIDTGEEKNVHPRNKEPVCDRLVRIALTDAYGNKADPYGPKYDNMRVEEGTIRVRFMHAGKGLVAKGGPLKGFQIAGEDKNFVTADARIETDAVFGDSIVVSSPEVKSPVAVRYAFFDFPEGVGCNLYNSADLPAAPFRSDKWDYPIKGIVEN